MEARAGLAFGGESMRHLVLVLIALLPVVAASCGGNDSSGVKPGAFPTSSDPSKSLPAGSVRQINAVVAGSDWYVGDNNFAFGITDANDQPVGGAQATATFYDLANEKNPKPVSQGTAVQSAPGVGPKVAQVHADGEVHVHGGEDDNRVGYYIKTRFDHAGLWGVAVEATLTDGTHGTSNVAFEVNAKPTVPAPGARAIPSNNLTRADVVNISEIDSGSPPNDMHDVKIKDAIARGRPLVVVFSTPAFCTSRFCGPVTEEVESLQADYKDRVDFVHIEIWRDFDKQLLNPTAKEWLQGPDGGLTEPWVFVIDSKGVIYDRWGGPVARNIMEPAVKAVAAKQ
jgi:hypothetical protein